MKNMKKYGSILIGSFVLLYVLYAAVFAGLEFFEAKGSPFMIRGPGVILLLIGISLVAYGLLYEKFNN
jgi:hypothetical protein